MVQTTWNDINEEFVLLAVAAGSIKCEPNITFSPQHACAAICRQSVSHSVTQPKEDLEDSSLLKIEKQASKCCTGHYKSLFCFDFLLEKS